MSILDLNLECIALLLFDTIVLMVTYIFCCSYNLLILVRSDVLIPDFFRSFISLTNRFVSQRLISTFMKMGRTL